MGRRAGFSLGGCLGSRVDRQKMDGWMDRWNDKLICGRVDERMEGRTTRLLCVCLNRWMDR